MKKRIWRILAVFIILTSLLAACGSPTGGTAEEANSTDLQGTLTISGAFALYPMMTVWAEEFSRLHPDVYFDVQGGGAGKGMTDTITGAVDIGMVSRAIKDEEIAKGIFWIPVTKDAVFPIISAENPFAERIMAQGLSQEVIHKIYISGEITTWGEVLGDPAISDEIHIFTRSDAAGAAEQWAKYAGGEAQEDLLGIGVNSEPAIVDTVSKDPLGIGYGNLNSIFDMGSGNAVVGIMVPPLDVNADGVANPEEVFIQKKEAMQAIADGTYPSPPARFENLVTMGKPEGLTLAFLQWILTDGQQYLEEAGFVPLTPEQQTAALEKLE